MQITVLGSGTGVPLAYRASPALMIRTGKHCALFDPGPGTLRQMAKIGLDFQIVDRIFLTHFHPDHSSDLIHFLFAKKNFSKSQVRPVAIAGPAGLETFLERLKQIYGNCLTLPEGIMITEEFRAETRFPLDCGSFTIAVQTTNHTTESIAYRIEDCDGKSAVFSGDTGFCREIIDLAKATDLLVLECSVPEGSRFSEHLTPSLAGKVAQLAGARRLILTHFYPECLKTDIVFHCRKAFKGELTLASDLLEIHI